MLKPGTGIGLVWFVFAAAVLVFAQDNEHHTGKAGQWEITTTMTYQQSPVPPGTRGGPPAAGSHTTTVCLTQEMVDAGALLPQSRGQCRIEDKVVKPGSLTANYVCTGKMKGKGVLAATFADLEHATASLHFEGTLDVDAHAKPIEWTAVSNYLFKGAQCSNGPAPAPANPTK